MEHDIWWEVTYGDSRTVSQKMGGNYEKLDRANIASFLLRDAEGPIVELTPDGSRTGHNLIYRKRNCLIWPNHAEVVYVLGWIPQGPIFAVAAESFEIWESAEWIIGDPVFYPPTPMLFERWDVDSRTRIINPAHERID